MKSVIELNTWDYIHKHGNEHSYRSHVHAQLSISFRIQTYEHNTHISSKCHRERELCECVNFWFSNRMPHRHTRNQRTSKSIAKQIYIFALNKPLDFSNVCMRPRECSCSNTMRYINIPCPVVSIHFLFVAPLTFSICAVWCFPVREWISCKSIWGRHDTTRCCCLSLLTCPHDYYACHVLEHILIYLCMPNQSVL